MKLDANAGANSTLAKPVQDLIKMIFDVESMKKAMVEFEVHILSLSRRIDYLFDILSSLSVCVIGIWNKIIFNLVNI